MNESDTVLVISRWATGTRGQGAQVARRAAPHTSHKVSAYYAGANVNFCPTKVKEFTWKRHQRLAGDAIKWLVTQVFH